MRSIFTIRYRKPSKISQVNTAQILSDRTEHDFLTVKELALSHGNVYYRIKLKLNLLRP